MYMQLLPILLSDVDSLAFIVNIAGAAANLPETSLESAAGEGNLVAVEPHAVVGEGRADGDGGGGAEMVGVEGDADAVVDGQDEGLVPLAPVLDHRDVGGRLRRHHQHPFLLIHGGHSIGSDINIKNNNNNWRAAVMGRRKRRLVLYSRGEWEKTRRRGICSLLNFCFVRGVEGGPTFAFPDAIFGLGLISLSLSFLLIISFFYSKRCSFVWTEPSL